jgi:cyclopropane-fatty-acyl-phospholipid synthase
MKSSSAKNFVQDLLKTTKIHLNGHQPWDIHVHNDEFFPRVIQQGALGLGESYMDKWWDCERLDIFFEYLFAEKIDSKVKLPWHFILKQLMARIVNFQTKNRAKEVGKIHYDLGNDLFKAMLDKHMMYSCGYWKTANTLDEAQTHKLDLICQKLQLRPGLRVLDIGCGWGGLAKYAAEKYGVNVVGVTISQQQYEYAKKDCEQLPIQILLKDYRDIQDTFDRIVSVGMFEHVGHHNYATFMQTVHRCLADDGLFLLHTIGANQTNFLANEWTLKYIFPNGMLPSIAMIAQASEKLFVMEDWHNFGADYDKTLMAWYHNFHTHWDELKTVYDERFYRLWTFYLLSSAGGFRARTMQLWQVLFSKNGVEGGYIAPR